MWIMLTSKLPTQVSPPKMSLFSAEPWTDSEYTKDQVEDFLKNADFEFTVDDDGRELPSATLREKARLHLAQQPYAIGLWGFEPNFSGAVGINYKGERLRVFPHEFSALSQESMAIYIGNTGVEASHILMPESSAQIKIVGDILNGSMREIYDAALLDGCNHEQAVTTALGVDIVDPNFLASFPVAGWYRCRREYAEMFCSEYEMEETDKREPGDVDFVPAKKKKSYKRAAALNRAVKAMYQ